MITVDLRSRTPIYEQLTENICRMILSGELKPDEQLPSVRALASELGINPNTIQKAYTELERRGALYSLKGRGNFVTSDISVLGEGAKNEFEDQVRSLMKKAKESGMNETDAAAMFDALLKEIWRS